MGKEFLLGRIEYRICGNFGAEAFQQKDPDS